MTTRFYLACFLFLTMPLLAQDDQAAQVRWMKHMTPGVAHKHLAELTGKFKAAHKFWMAPGAEAVESELTCENVMLFGGRYQRSTYAGTIMGMIYEGEGLTSFDNSKSAFQMTWIDNVRTEIMVMSGTYDEPTHTLTLKGHMYDATSDKEIEVKMVLRYESKDKYIMEMYVGDFKTMEITHTRA